MAPDFEPAPIIEYPPSGAKGLVLSARYPVLVMTMTIVHFKSQQKPELQVTTFWLLIELWSRLGLLAFAPYNEEYFETFHINKVSFCLGNWILHQTHNPHTLLCNPHTHQSTFTHVHSPTLSLQTISLNFLSSSLIGKEDVPISFINNTWKIGVYSRHFINLFATVIEMTTV